MENNLQQFSQDIKTNNGSDMFTMKLWLSSQPPYKPGVYFIQVELRNVKKYYEIMYNRNLVGVTILDAKEINMEYAVDLAWMTDSNLRKAYFQMCRMINR